MSLMRILSAVVPNRAATFPSTSAKSRPLAWVTASSSPESMAKMAAPLGSLRNRIPSGPKAMGPMDWRSGVPAFMLALKSPAVAEHANRPRQPTPASSRNVFLIMSCLLSKTIAVDGGIPFLSN